MTTRKERAIDRLYKAVAHYVEINKGKVAVVGGIQIQQWDTKKANFTVGIKCNGKLPPFAQ